ncbi:transposase [Rickettsia endosymbiont of Urophora cardui]
MTKANRADLSVLESITQKITGKVFGDKAYICKELWFKLYSRNLRMITNIRKDMKNYLLELEDQAMLPEVLTKILIFLTKVKIYI